LPGNISAGKSKTIYLLTYIEIYTLSSIAMLLFCTSFWFWTTSLCLLVNGAAQAPIWPAKTKMLSSWFPESKLSSVFGLVSTASYVGALVGTGIAVYIQVTKAKVSASTRIISRATLIRFVEG
jgi:sugar phosphate permease